MILYHAVGAGWTEGEPLYTFNDLGMNSETDWKWQEVANEPHDLDCVSFTDFDEAAVIAEEFCLRILACDIPDDRLRPNDERYPAVYGTVPTAWIIGVVTQPINQEAAVSL